MFEMTTRLVGLNECDDVSWWDGVMCYEVQTAGLGSKKQKFVLI